jgi:hypothetical protein
VIIAVQHLVDRQRMPRSRADEVATLRRRLAAVGSTTDEAEVIDAIELRRLKAELSEALAGVESCRGCAKGHPLPAGRWNGGHCCSGRTSEIFSDDEVRALKRGGTTPADLAPPISDHAGCAFRGPSGCSLAPIDRPTLCVRYLCLDLRGELDRRGDLREIKAISADLEKTFQRFVRRARAT